MAIRVNHGNTSQPGQQESTGAIRVNLGNTSELRFRPCRLPDRSHAELNASEAFHFGLRPG